jgi:hypothetical protein
MPMGDLVRRSAATVSALAAVVAVDHGDSSLRLPVK